MCNGYEDLQRDADLNMENELVEFFTRERYLIQIEPNIEGDAFSFLGLLFLTQSDFDKEWYAHFIYISLQNYVKVLVIC